MDIKHIENKMNQIEPSINLSVKETQHNEIPIPVETFIVEQQCSTSIISDISFQTQNIIEISNKTVKKIRKKNIFYIFKIIQVVIARLILIGCLSWVTYFTICSSRGDRIYFLILIPIFIIAFEAVFICIARKGSDFSWFV